MVLTGSMPTGSPDWNSLDFGLKIAHGRQTWLRAVGCVLAFAAACPSGFTQQTSPSRQRGGNDGGLNDASEVYQSAIVVDTHADTPMRITDENFDLASDAGLGHWDLKKAEAGGLGAEFFSIYVEPTVNKGHYARRALDMIDAVYRAVEAHPDAMVMAFSSSDILAARNGTHPRIASLLGVEGGHAIEGDIRLLRDFYRLGARYMTLTWANSNELGQSSGDLAEGAGAAADPGLTEFGRTVVREMNRLGMMVDISHVSDQSFYDALAVTSAPVIASHSSARALTNFPRNMTDDMLRALARNGGVAQVNFNCGFIDQNYLDAFRKLYAGKSATRDAIEAQFNQHKIGYNEYLRALNVWSASVPRPPLESLIDHIDHTAKIAGVDHVGLGSDFDGVPCLPKGVDSVADLPKITQALLKRGYSADDVQKILGGNLLRVFREAEKVSREMQK
jgi:membrane dipeptidase